MIQHSAYETQTKHHSMAEKKFTDVRDSEQVEFFLYPDIQVNGNESQVNLQAVDDVLGKVNNIVTKLTEDYIWHNDEFNVAPHNIVSYLHSNANDTEAFSLYGTLNYGENIDDEWFLVYLLLELTKQIKQLVVRVKDGDGEFLLIELADHLPSWVTPETCEDRVFLYKGKLHILPELYKFDKVNEEVLKYIQQHPGKSRANANIQQALQQKIEQFPVKAKACLHKQNLFLPVGVAALLNARPKLIATAVRAFTERDLVDIKACRAMKYFPPENRVNTQVTFTRCLYAMLVSSKYIPDKCIGWNLPAPSEDHYKPHILGVKVACGFEILLSQARSQKSKAGGDSDLDFENDSNWKKFLGCLTSRDYFRGLLEFSKEHTSLLDAAREFYRTSCCKSMKPSKANVVAELMESIEVDVEELRKREQLLPPSDDDSWMNITQQDLDAMLQAKFGPLGDNLEMTNGNADIAQHLKTFIHHVSGLEGAEFPQKEQPKTAGPTRPKRGIKNKKRKSVKFSPDTKMHSVTSTDNIPTAPQNRVQFEPDGFINAIQNILSNDSGSTAQSRLRRRATWSMRKEKSERGETATAWQPWKRDEKEYSADKLLIPLPVPHPAHIAINIHNRDSDEPIPVHSDTCQHILKALEDSQVVTGAVARYRGGSAPGYESTESRESSSPQSLSGEDELEERVAMPPQSLTWRGNDWPATQRKRNNSGSVRVDLASPEDISLDTDSTRVVFSQYGTTV